MSPICPEIGVRICVMASDFRPPTSHVFRVERARGPVWYVKVPATPRAPGSEEARARMDRPRSTAGWVLHEAARGGLAAVRVGRGPARDVARVGEDRCDVRRRGRRVPPLHRARPRTQAIDAAGYRSAINAHLLPAFRLDARRGGDNREDRAMARGLRRLGADEEQAADPAARNSRTGQEDVPTSG
jgi:hypothetical protein